MDNANTKIYDKTIDRAAMIRLYERRVNGKVEIVLDDHVVRLDKIIKNSGLSVKQREYLFKSIDDELLSTFKQVHNISSRSLLDLVSDQASYTYQNLEVAVGKIWKTERPPKRIAEDIVLKQPLYKNQTLSAGWTGISINERKRIEAVVRKGIADNNSIDEIALAVRRGNIHNITRAQSKALVVTAVTSVTAQADHAVYQANKKALKGYQYVAVLDSRTTPLCAHRDGHVYPIDDTVHLPPAHYYCRSTTVPVVMAWKDLAEMEGVAQVRKKNLEKLTDKEIAYYDGLTPMRESYNDWLLRQSRDVQIRHLGDYKKVQLFNSGQLHLSKFTNDEGNTIGIRELRKLTDSSYTLPNDTVKFAAAKQRLDAMQLGINRPEDLLTDPKVIETLRDYYILQSRELNGTLSLTNYRGALLHTKKAAKSRVLTMPPTEDQLKFNPITGRYEDVRLYQPNPAVLNNNLKLVSEAEELLDTDKKFIKDFIVSLEDQMSVNERAVITDNLRIILTRYRKNPEVWANFKAVVQGQIKFDIMNVSDAIETQIRKDQDVLKKLLQDNYIDPVLGPVQLQDLHDTFIDNILEKNKWEDRVAPKVAKELRSVFDLALAKERPVIWNRISEKDLDQFYLKFAHRLSLSETPDRDQLAVSLGRDLYNLANFTGTRKEWYNLGLSILDSKRVHKFFEVETFGVQKRRMKSRMSGAYFGPYYDTLTYNIRVTDPRIQEYIRLTRKVELGLRVSVTEDKNRLLFREGYKTYFVDRGLLGLEDTRIPITSTTSFSEFPEEFIDKDFVDALNWASKAKYKIDEDYFDAINKLLYFEDDRGKAKYYNELNEFRKYIASRGDTYERFKAMEWLRRDGKSFSNHPFIDHRARIYDRGLISPQSGETFRPFLNTSYERVLGVDGYYNFKDQVGSFLGGLSDYFEGRYNGLSFPGRQKIAEKWWPELTKLGNHMLRGKPNDIRAILESPLTAEIDGEDLAKFYRFALETAKLDNYLGNDYSIKSLSKLESYKTALALEQDASSSGAQIIALTTRNKQLAELSNVIPTAQKKRLYDEIAAATYNDPRFKVLNQKLGLNEKDLRKAAKAQNMVTFYGAGERTGILRIEDKLQKVLGKDTQVLVVKTAERDQVLNEISAQIAKYEKFDMETAGELKALRNDVKDIFNKGINPGDDIIEQLWFLQPQTRDFVEKLSMSYQKVVTPDDFKAIGKIMSEHLSDQVPILRDFTRYFGRLAEDFLTHAKPSDSRFDWKTISKTVVRGTKTKGYALPDWLSRVLGIRAGEPVTEKFLKRFAFWKPNGTLSEVMYGVASPADRRTGGKFFKLELKVPAAPTLENIRKLQLLKKESLLEVEVLYANKMPKAWTNVPWVNFDKKIVEQNFTQTFEERLVYKDKFGNWVTNILQVPQKTSTTWWDELFNADGKINDIADATKARTAFAVNGNHSNDAVIVKKFHLWGRKQGIPTSTIHDAFFTNAAEMQQARKALRGIYSQVLENNVIVMTLDEMKARGLPNALYKKYLDEAIDKGLIPIPGRSVIGGKIIDNSDILKKEDILEDMSIDFKRDRGWYGVG